MVVGLTGGIGSGKSTVAEYFKTLGIPVYNADDEAKMLMNSSKTIQLKLKELLGDNAVIEGQINRPYISNKVFKNKGLLDALNAIVHPEVKNHFSKWLAQQKSSYIIKESALIFENNMKEQFDLVISVLANKEDRINRIISRDVRSVDQINSILDNQTTDVVRKAQSDYIIQNNDLESLRSQVEQIHHKILNI